MWPVTLPNAKHLFHEPFLPSWGATMPTLQGEETHHVAVIMSNPEQSKHLETARMKASIAPICTRI